MKKHPTPCAASSPGCRQLWSRAATLFRDGANAHRKGSDYRKEEKTVAAAEHINLHLAPGGGFTIHLEKIH